MCSWAAERIIYAMLAAQLVITLPRARPEEQEREEGPPLTKTYGGQPFIYSSLLNTPGPDAALARTERKGLGIRLIPRFIMSAAARFLLLASAKAVSFPLARS